MRHETILSGNIYIYIYTRTNIKNEIERGGGGEKSKGNENGEFGRLFEKEKRMEARLRSTRWPHGENEFRSSSSSRSIPITFA